MRAYILAAVLMCLCIESQAQNRDSLARVNRFNSFFRTTPKEVQLIKSIDSLKYVVKEAEAQNQIKGYRLMESEKEAGRIERNLLLYAFLVKTEKDSLKNLANDTSGFVRKDNDRYSLIFNDKVDFESLQSIIGNQQLSSQFPLLFSHIANGDILVIEEVVEAIVRGVSGMALPDWPAFTAITVSQEQRKRIYQQHEQYFNVYATQNACVAAYMGMYKHFMLQFQYPRDIVNMIDKQVIFKTFLDEQCSH